MERGLHRLRGIMARRSCAQSRRTEVRVGVSGWRYPHWRGVFYPPGLAQKRELEFLSRTLRTVEINGTFYSLQRLSSYLAWYRATPPSFVFGVKGSRFVTHAKRLRDCERPLANFFASGVLALEEKLGPVLWQLPPTLAFEPERVAAFVAALPRTTAAAATLARTHDERVRHGAYVEVRADRPLRHAIEPRHSSFASPELVRILRAGDVALCVADSAGVFHLLEHLTADFVYVRLHGSEALYRGRYSPTALDAWAERIEGWRTGAADESQGRDVYVYFDNDAEAGAPLDALRLEAHLRTLEEASAWRAP